ncbi:MAG TPA: hypothetical protein PK677_09720 [Acidiphilium sp.]|nr:hypothetical protein [Acidiphilium sp.]
METGEIGLAAEEVDCGSAGRNGGTLRPSSISGDTSLANSGTGRVAPMAGVLLGGSSRLKNPITTFPSLICARRIAGTAAPPIRPNLVERAEIKP